MPFNSISKIERRLVWLILIVTFLKGATWAALVPIWQAPDEYVHFSPMQFIAERGKLPGPDDFRMSQELCASVELLRVHHVAFRPLNRSTFVESPPHPRRAELASLPQDFRWTSADEGCLSVAMHLPPLYYLLGAGVYRLVYGADLFVRAFAIRLLSVVLSTLTVFITWLIGKEIFPSSRALRLTLSILVSFQPMFTFLGAVINTDSLLYLLSTIVIYVSILIALHGLSWRRAWVAGVVLGLGILTKPHIYALVPVLALALCIDIWPRRDTWRRWIPMVAVICLACAILGGLGILRNFQLNGSFFYASPQSELWGTPPNPNYTWNGIDFIDWYENQLRTLLLRSYWGNFGWLDTLMPWSIYLIIRWSIILSLIGLAIYTGRSIAGKQWEPQQIGVVLSLVATLSIISMLGVFGYLRMKNYGAHQPAQGRYFLNMISAQMLLLMVGFIEITPNYFRSLTHTALRITFIGLNLLALIFVVVPRYYELPDDPTASLIGWSPVLDSQGATTSGFLVSPQRDNLSGLTLWIQAGEETKSVQLSIQEINAAARRFESPPIKVVTSRFPVQLEIPDTVQIAADPLYITAAPMEPKDGAVSIDISTGNPYTPNAPPIMARYRFSFSHLGDTLKFYWRFGINRTCIMMNRITQLKPEFFQGKWLAVLLIITGLGTLVLARFLIREPGRGKGIRRSLPLLAGCILSVLWLGYGFEVGKEPRWVKVPLQGTSAGATFSQSITSQDLSIALDDPSTIVQDPGNYVDLRWVEIEGRSLPAVWMHAPSSVTYRLDIQENAQLVFDLALAPETWHPDYGDGVAFMVVLVNKESETPLFWETIEPKHDLTDRGWLSRSVDLGSFAGQTINLRFQTQPLADNDWDWSMWGAPRILTPGVDK